MNTCTVFICALAQGEDGRDARKQRCAEIVDELHQLSITATTGKYRGTTWVNLGNPSRTTGGGFSASNAMKAFGSSLMDEGMAIAEIGLGMANSAYGAYSGYSGYYDSINMGNYGSAGAQLSGGTAGAISSFDSLYKARSGVSALSKRGSLVVRSAGLAGAIYTAGSLAYGTYNYYEPTPIRLTPNPSYSGNMETLHDTVFPMIQAQTSLYQELNCTEFYE